MDKIDAKILKELDLNPKIYFSRLAKKCLISEQVADYRIKRLIKLGLIRKFGTIINLNSLEQEHYRLFFNFNHTEKYSNENIFKFLKEKKGVYWAARIGGKYDLHITLFVYDFDELEKFIDEFIAEFPGLIRDYVACYGLEHYIYNHKYLSHSSRTIKYGYKDKKAIIDKIDCEILKKLKDNCRLSSVEISKGKNRTYKTIINRIKNLEKKKIILGYRMFISSSDKKPFIILLSFQDYSKEKEKKLMSYLESNKSITQTIRTFGTWNLFLHARTENPESLQNLLIDMKTKFQIIKDVEIMPVFEDILIDLMPI